jgi:hypothetical protein
MELLNVVWMRNGVFGKLEQITEAEALAVWASGDTFYDPMVWDDEHQMYTMLSVPAEVADIRGEWDACWRRY